MSQDHTRLPPTRGEGQGLTADVWMDALSDDARALAGCCFGVIGRKATLTFQTPWNCTPRAVAALTELVSAGVLSAVDGIEGRWARTYRPLVDTRAAFRWVHENIEGLEGIPLMVPDDQRRERPPRNWGRVAAGQSLTEASVYGSSPLINDAHPPGGNSHEG